MDPVDPGAPRPGGNPAALLIGNQQVARAPFLLSLAEAYGHRAVAVILSGMGQDGSASPKGIKPVGGVTFAQSHPAPTVLVLCDKLVQPISTVFLILDVWRPLKITITAMKRDLTGFGKLQQRGVVGAL